VENISITTLTLIIVQTLKQTSIDNKWLPTIAGFVGLILAEIAWVSKAVTFNNWMDASVCGVVSGLAAVGVHQVQKQLSSAKNLPIDIEVNNTEDTTNTEDAVNTTNTEETKE